MVDTAATIHCRCYAAQWTKLTSIVCTCPPYAGSAGRGQQQYRSKLHGVVMSDVMS
jgi:hypothetical protein